MIKRIAFTASLLTALAAAAQAQVPFLSFADNFQASQPVYAITRTAPSGSGGNFESFVSGGGSGYTSLTSPIASQLTSVSYTINSPITATSSSNDIEGDALLGAGSITVTDASLGTLFTVSFDSGSINSGTLGGSDLPDGQGGFLNFDNVVYSDINSNLLPFVTNNQTNAFSLSFANRSLSSTEVRYSTSGSFGSQPVPEPATMAALGLGAAAMLRRRRKA